MKSQCFKCLQDQATLAKCSNPECPEFGKQYPWIHPPWPTGIPYCTGMWVQADYNKHAEAYRPKGYTGHPWDYRAYKAWKENNEHAHSESNR